MSVWMVTGASRGLGLEITEAAVRRGHHVVAGARTPEDMREWCSHESVTPVRLDVTDDVSVRDAVAEAVDRCGGVDVLVNNAGIGIVGALEELSDAEALKLFEVNVFGVHRMIRAVLPHMRQQQSGYVINLGSGAGFLASATHALYGATKFAVEAITEALALEAAPFGIHSTVVEPGAFRTDFLSARSIGEAAVVLPEYVGTPGGAREAFMSPDGVQPGDPTRAAEVIVSLADLAAPPLRLPLGTDCVARLEGKIATLQADLDQWRHLSESTDYELGQAQS